jgi:hypothetical protein
MPTSPAQNHGGPGNSGNRWLLAAKLIVLVGFLFFFHQVGQRLTDLIASQAWPRHADMVILFLFLAVAAYVILLSIPFLPGIEIGLMLMSMLGAPGIALVYLATVLALSFSFLLGRRIPPHMIGRALEWFHLERARELVGKLEPLGPEERVRFLVESAPSSMVPFMTRHRYLMVAILFNLPGNALIGGGGGISLISGMSRLFPFPRYLLLISLAVIPGPLFFLLRGLNS